MILLQYFIHCIFFLALRNNFEEIILFYSNLILRLEPKKQGKIGNEMCHTHYSILFAIAQRILLYEVYATTVALICY